MIIIKNQHYEAVIDNGSWESIGFYFYKPLKDTYETKEDFLKDVEELTGGTEEDIYIWDEEEGKAELTHPIEWINDETSWMALYNWKNKSKKEIHKESSGWNTKSFKELCEKNQPNIMYGDLIFTIMNANAKPVKDLKEVA